MRKISGRIYVIRHVMAAIYGLAGRLRIKSLPVKSEFLYGTLRYRYETLHGISLLQNLGLH